jgi:hypothetical protein
MRETSGSGTRLKFDLGCSPVKRLSCIRERNWVHMLIFAIFLENFWKLHYYVFFEIHKSVSNSQRL